VSPELERLLALRGLDIKIYQYEEKLNGLPRRLRSTQERLATARENLEKQQQLLKDLALERREGEHEVEALAAEELKFESRTPEVKTNEELRALRKEIEGVQGRRSVLETKVLEGMEHEDAERERLPGLEKEVSQAEAADQAEREAISQEQGELERSRDGVAEQRLAVMEELRPQLRARYERVRKAHRAEAVVPLEKNACGGCQTAQPPQRIQEVRGGDRLVICEFCGRLIIGENEAAL
jgi:predicted  nucleic acid-binding Zn-ribbon protein